MSEKHSFYKYRGTTPAQAFAAFIFVLVLVAGVVVCALSYHHHLIYKNITLISEQDGDFAQGSEDALATAENSLSPIQKDISDEVFELLEDTLYDTIVEIDNSENFTELEEEIERIALSKLNHAKLRFLVGRLGQEYVDDLRVKGHIKIRMKVDKRYDDEYIDEIVSDVLPKLQSYWREIVRRKVLDRIYARVNDNVIDAVADEILDELRIEYARKLKEQSEKEIDSFLQKLDDYDNSKNKNQISKDKNLKNIKNDEKDAEIDTDNDKTSAESKEQDTQKAQVAQDKQAQNPQSAKTPSPKSPAPKQDNAQKPKQNQSNQQSSKTRLNRQN